MGCFLLSLHKIVSQVLQAWCTLGLLELNWWGEARTPQPGWALQRLCSGPLHGKRDSTVDALYPDLLLPGEEGKISIPGCRKYWKSPFPYSALWSKQAENCCEGSPIVPVWLTEALLQKETPFLSKEQGARTERQVPSCSSGKSSRAVRRRRRRVWERQRLACDLGVKESTVEQDQ